MDNQCWCCQQVQPCQCQIVTAQAQRHHDLVPLDRPFCMVHGRVFMGDGLLTPADYGLMDNPGSVNMERFAAWAASIADQFDLVCLDVDGTLVQPKDGRKFRQNGHPEDWQFIGQRNLMVLMLQAVKVQCCIVTNQAGVAFGYFDQGDMQVETWQIGAECGVTVDRVFVCFTHPTAKVDHLRREDDRRKPGPGMIRDALALIKATPDRTLMVGDRDEDQLAAQAAGVHFLWADTFFDDVPALADNRAN